ncbi:PLP-dependent transferase [Xylariaceae sp. FL0594]|nr:PLP-dependent transferase [Xylariaceae sp. FL0594]
MVGIPPFEVEQWMDAYENTPDVLNIAETCASSISISDLSNLAEGKEPGTPASGVLDLSARMTYGAIRGSEELRQNIAALYSNPELGGAGREEEVTRVSPDNIIITQGAIAANHLIFYALVGPGDHVVCVFPVYQQLYTVPETLGAEVSLWKLKAEDEYVPDVRELKRLIKSNTKMIVINNPNNPTGSTIPEPVLEDIIAIARDRNITILSDEVYRPLFHSLPASSSSPSPSPPPSLLALSLKHSYPNIITTSSLSKAWALAGIRVGWLATPSLSLLSQIASARDYTTISVSQLDDQIARFALSASVAPKLLARNAELARTNLGLLSRFVEVENSDVCDWVRPTAGTTAFVRFFKSSSDGKQSGGAGGGGGEREPVDDAEFCKDLLYETGVMAVPGGKCFGVGVGGSGSEGAFKGFVRIGYVCETEVLRKALEKMTWYVNEKLR